jgi:predicted transcriptional regulator
MSEKAQLVSIAGESAMLPLSWPWELIALQEDKRWLVDRLWLDQGVGIIGGEPKCCKSFLAIDLAVAVASGTAALGEFKVNTSGLVLYFAAEDALHIVRSRLDGICAASQIDLKSLKLQLITSHSLRLDLPEDVGRLERTIAAHRPKLLILDPFVRLHRIDENNSGEVAPILAGLRRLQRAYGVAIMLVHHAKKGANSARAGQALRGSSEFHAWGDCNLYLRRDGKEHLNLSIEHRAEASFAGLPLKLESKAPSLALRLDRDRGAEGFLNPQADQGSQVLLEQLTTQKTARASEQVQNKILSILKESKEPLPIRQIRDACGVRTTTVSSQIQMLVKAGQIQHSDLGYTAVL